MVHYQSNGMQGNTTQLTSKRGRICHLSEELIQEENSVLQEKRVVMCQLCSELHCSLHSTPPPSSHSPPPSLLPTWSMLSLIGRMESLTDASSMDGCIASSGRVNSTFRHTYMCGGVIDTTWWYMQTCVQTGMRLMKTTSSAFRTLFVVQVLEQRGYTLLYLNSE